MYVLLPVFHETIWGGRKLSGYDRKKTDRIGHMYMINGHGDMANTVVGGAEKGKRLDRLFDEKKKEWGMEKYEEFPLTIALVDAAQNLSIQVHPDDEAAERIEGKKIGKTESWVFLDAPEDGWIYAGCGCGSREQVEAAVREGKMEEITKRFPVAEMDYVCVRSGTLHAMTKGSFVYEIEYGSDYTYRFYDYGRRDENGKERQLHTEKALMSVIPNQGTRKAAVKEGVWVSENEYEICLLDNISEYANLGKEIECIAVIDGEGYADETNISAGMGILLMPGEEISGVSFKRIITARLRQKK